MWLSSLTSSTGAGNGLPWQCWGKMELKDALPHSQGALLLCSTLKMHLVGWVSETETAVCSNMGTQGQLSPKEMSELHFCAAFSGLQCWEKTPHRRKLVGPIAWPVSALPQAPTSAHACHGTEMQHSVSPQAETNIKKKKTTTQHNKKPNNKKPHHHTPQQKRKDLFPSFCTCDNTVKSQNSRIWATVLTLTLRKASTALGSE